MAAEGNRQGRKRVARLRIKPQARPSSTITPKNRRQRSRIASKRRNPGSRAATNILPRRLLALVEYEYAAMYFVAQDTMHRQVGGPGGPSSAPLSAAPK